MESSKAIIPPCGHKRKRGSAGDQRYPPRGCSGVAKAKDSYHASKRELAHGAPGAHQVLLAEACL